MRLSLLLFPLLGQSVLSRVLARNEASANIIEQRDVLQGLNTAFESSAAIEKRAPPQCPTVASLLAKIRAYGIVKTHFSIFYTSWDNYPQAYKNANICKSINNKGNCVVYDQSMADADYRHFASPGKVTPEQDMQRIRAISSAFAQGSVGIAYVVVPDGKAFKPDSTWMNYEFPNLLVNHDIHEIVKIEFPSMKQTVIYRMEKGVLPGVPKPNAYPPKGADPKIFTPYH